MQLSVRMRTAAWRRAVSRRTSGGVLPGPGAAAIALSLALAVTSLPEARAGAEDIGVEDQEASYLFRFFSDADDVHVSSHYGFYDLVLENGPTLSLHVNRERVVVPAVSAPPGSEEAVDAITTASRPIAGKNAFDDFVKVRNEVQAGVDYRNVSLGYYVSHESDYFAQQVRGGVQKGFAQDNTTLSLGGSYGWDAIEPLADDDSATLDDHQNTLHGNLGLTQVLSPSLVVRLGAEVTQVTGLQHNPYRNVYAGGGPQPERHPDDRMRTDYFVKLNKYLANRSSLKLMYRFYHDDWDVRSHTMGVRLNQYVTRNIVVRYRYRYYDQTAASFYRPEYEEATGVDGFRTGDYRLQPLTSHLFGTRMEIGLQALSPQPALLRRVTFAINYERYFNNTNFSANVFESGLVYEF